MICAIFHYPWGCVARFLRRPGILWDLNAGDTCSTQLGLVVFLSVLLDFFAAFFVGVIGEELRFHHFWRVYPPLTIDAITEPLPSITSVLSLQSKQTDTCVSEPELSIAEQVSQALASRALPCSKKGGETLRADSRIGGYPIC
ncbi:MAG: hypothetical protein LPD71_08725 [Shewanella sp.]|nr:hypothetical protein [Shewanella sp.]MCF1431670.1 hypothetical protein [Shewanella sp.]MCF1438811.1 hypothetical protein [Shewanella sp.]MCF1457734.1 hypothetical protein [Shewanella sp.]